MALPEQVQEPAEQEPAPRASSIAVWLPLPLQLHSCSHSSPMWRSSQVHSALEKSHADATAEALGIHRDAAQSISDERTKLQEDTAARLAEETSAAEARIADEQAAARETIPEVAGDVTRAAVERLIGVDVAEADAKSAVEAAMRGGA